MALTPQQKAFIDKYISNLDLTQHKEKKLRDLYEKFAERYNDAQKSLSVLPQGDATRARLDPLLAAADQKARNGEFKAAYKDLKQVQKDAALASNGYLAWITSSTLSGLLKQAEDDLAECVREVDRAVSRLKALVPGMARIRSVSDFNTISDAALYRKKFATQEAVLRTDFDVRVGRVNDAAALVAAKGLPAQITEIKRLVKLAQDDGRAQEIAAEVARLKQLDADSAQNGGFYVQNMQIYAIRNPERLAFENRLKEIKNFSKFKTTENADSIALEEVFAMYGGVAMEKGLTHATEKDGDTDVISVMERLQAEEEARLEAARQRYRDDKKHDAALSDDANKGRVYDAEVAEELETFDTAAILDGLLTPPLPQDLDPAEIKRRAAQAKLALEGFMGTSAPDDESLLDLMLKGEKQLFETMALTAGVPTDPKQCQPAHLALIEEMVAVARQVIIDEAPNKMAADGKSLTMNGVTWELEAVLASGANGTAKRYVDRATGKSIVVKTPNVSGNQDAQAVENGRAAMAEEVLIHARLLKGDTTESKSTMIGLEGAAIGPDGMLHMIMEDAKGGDLSKVADNMNVMVETGVLPPEARQVLAQDLIRQTVAGLRYMEEHNAIHNDLKPGNILMLADGTVKITDFGESRFADDQGEHPSAKVSDFRTTPKYEAPEQFDGKTITSSVDTFALGGIIQALMGTSGELPIGNPGGNDGVFMSPSQKTNQGPVSAMDRVVEGVLEPKPEDRPSLDAIAASALLSTNIAAQDYTQADIDELKRCAAEYQQAMNVVRVKIPKNYIFGEDEGSKSLAKMQLTITYLEKRVGELQKSMMAEEARGADVSRNKEELAAFSDSVQKARKLRDDTLHTVREVGQANLDATLKDPKVKIDFQGATLTAPQALSIVDQAKERAETVKRDYYALQHKTNAEIKDIDEEIAELDDADLDGYARLTGARDDLLGKINTHADEANQRLAHYRDELDTIGGLLRDSAKEFLSPEGVLALAAEAMKDVGSRFGRPILRMTPPPLPEPKEKRRPRRQPIIGQRRNQQIPDPPEPPKKPKKEAKTQDDKQDAEL